MRSFTCTIPLRLQSAANLREHWAAKHRRVQKERQTVWLTLRASWGLLASPWQAPVLITITRLAPRAATHPLDGDNLQAACKATRDAVAQWLNIDDGDSILTWVYAQRPGKPKEYAVEITIEEVSQ